MTQAIINSGALDFVQLGLGLASIGFACRKAGAMLDPRVILRIVGEDPEILPGTPRVLTRRAECELQFDLAVAFRTSPVTGNHDGLRKGDGAEVDALETAWHLT